MNLKAQYQRFKAWQVKPISYSKEGLKEQHCANCGNDYTGNYCPVCGQSAGGSRLTWKTLHQNIMMMWGMDSRSMPSTIWQLLWRPGYFIGNYINGHRQASYPPVKMLFIVALAYSIIAQIVGLDHMEITLREGSRYYWIKMIIQWLIDHPGWGMMSLTLILILPTYVLFRFAPRNNRHTLPESVIIQIFMSTLMFICQLLSNATHWLLMLIPYYYFVSYKQLFGYSRWGTIWRMMVSIMVWGMVLVWLFFLFFAIGGGISQFTLDTLGQKVAFFFVITAVLWIPIVILLTIGYWIGIRGEKRRRL